MKKVYIIVLNYNNPHDTIICLESLYQLNYDNFHVVLCDNKSTDNSNELFNIWQNEYKPRDFTYIRLSFNGGYAAGNNAGLRFALAQGDLDYAWILNNDTVVTPDSLKNVVCMMERNQTIGICGSTLVYDWDRTKVQGYGGRVNHYLGTTTTIDCKADIEYMDYVIGAAMLLSKAFLLNVGLFAEEYFLYYEEPDLAERARGRYRLACAVDSIVYHKEGATIGANNRHLTEKSYLADYFSVRARLLYMKKFYPLRLPTVYLGLVVTMINRVRRRQYMRVLMVLKLMLGMGDAKLEALAVRGSA